MHLVHYPNILMSDCLLKDFVSYYAKIKKLKQDTSIGISDKL